MKIIYLLTNRIAQYFLKNKTIFVLFVLGGMINAIVFCYLYGNMLPAIRNRESLEIQYREYTVYLSEDTDVSHSLDSLLQTGLFDTLIAGYQTSRSRDGTFYTVYHGSLPLVKLNGACTIPQGNEILIPFFASEEVGETIHLQDYDWKVIGRHTGNEYYISQERYRQLFGDKANRVYAVSAKHYDMGRDSAGQALRDTFPTEMIKAPTLVQLADRNRSVSQLFSICLCYATAAISFAFLFQYLLESGVEENIVSLISGASKLTIAVMVFWEGVMLTSLSTLLGLLCHFLLMSTGFRKLNVNEELYYTFGDYSVIFLAIFLISVIILFFFTRKFTKVSPKQARRELT